MGIGTGIFLLAVGAILRFAVTTTAKGVNIQTVGDILMIVGALGILLSCSSGIPGAASATAAAPRRWSGITKATDVSRVPPQAGGFGAPARPCVPVGRARADPKRAAGPARRSAGCTSCFPLAGPGPIPRATGRRSRRGGGAADDPVVADIRGHGPAVVLLHGQPGSAADWAPLCPAPGSRLHGHRSGSPRVRPHRRHGRRISGQCRRRRRSARPPRRLVGDHRRPQLERWRRHRLGRGAPRPGGRAGAGQLGRTGEIDCSRLDRLLAIPPVGIRVAAVVLNVAGLVLSLAAVRQLRRPSGSRHVR